MNHLAGIVKEPQLPRSPRTLVVHPASRDPQRRWIYEFPEVSSVRLRVIGTEEPPILRVWAVSEASAVQSETRRVDEGASPFTVPASSPQRQPGSIKQSQIHSAGPQHSKVHP